VEDLKNRVTAIEKALVQVGMEVNGTRLETKALRDDFRDAVREMRSELAGIKEALVTQSNSILKLYQLDPRVDHAPGSQPFPPPMRDTPQTVTYRTPSRGVVVPTVPVVYETEEGEEIQIGYPPMRPREDSSVSIRAAGMGLRMRGPDAFKALAVLVLTALAAVTGYVLRAQAHPTKTVETSHETQVTK
jgi:hypothetical protein